LNSGTLVARGVNAMGSAGTLTINGGTIAANATRDFSGKYTSLTVGGNFQLGALSSAVPLSLDGANLTFNTAMGLGAATRTITIGGTGAYTLGGAISGSPGAGLTVNALSGASGTLSLTVANSYSGDTTISSGTLSIGSDTATLGNGAGTLILSGGTFFRASQTTAQTFANPISMTASSIIGGNPTSGSRTIPFSSSSISGSAGTLSISNTATSGTGALQVRFFGSFTFSQPVNVGKAFSSSFVYLQFYNTAATGDQTWSGLISGNGTLYKNVSSTPGGNVILSSPNTYTGGTEIRGGFFGLGTDNALGFGNVLIGFDSNPLGLFASGAARQLTNDIIADSAIINSTNLQIKGSQNLTLSGRVVITNVMQFTISNTALTTLSGAITNIGSAGGITKAGSGTLVLSGATAYTGSTRVVGGTLALNGTAVPAATTNLTLFGGTTLDVSGLSTTLALANSQSFQVASPTATATLIGSGTAGLTMGSTSPLVLAYANTIPSLTVTGGVLTLAVGNPVTVTVANGGIGLPIADYKLIAAGPGGSVAGTVPAFLTVNGDGLGGNIGSLIISNSELYLRVTTASAAPFTPVAKSSDTTNFTGFLAGWYPVGGAVGYRLDVSTASDFSSFVSGYSDRDVGNVTSFLVTNLNASTVYYYQVRATNSFGVSASSASVAVLTLDQPYLWNVAGGNWNDASSWQFANVPINGISTVFTGAGGNSVNDISGLFLQGILFTNGAGAYTVSGNTLVISNGIFNASTAIETISAPLTLGAPQALTASAGPINISGPLNNAGNALTFATTANSTNSGTISGAGALIKNGAGTLLLSGANNYTGATTNNGGNLEVAGGAALPDGATLALANTAGVTLTLDANETIGSISGGDNATVALGVNNLTVGGDGTSNSLASAISGTGKLVKTGAGPLTLNKTTAYGSSINLRVEGGTLDLNRAGSPLSGILGTGNRIELAGGNLQLSGALQANFAMSLGGLDIYSDTTLILNRNGAVSVQSPTITLPLNFKADAKLTFVYSTNITGGTTTFDAAANTLQGNATLMTTNFVVAIANPIGESGGSFGLTKIGAGQLNLLGINTYSGNTTISTGTLGLNGTSTLGTGAGALNLAGGNLLIMNDRGTTANNLINPINLSANAEIQANTTTGTRNAVFGGVITGSAGTLTLHNTGTTGPATFAVRFTNAFTFGQPIVGIVDAATPGPNAVTLTVYNRADLGDQKYDGIISGPLSITRSVTTAGTGGRVIFTAANTYSGNTTNNDGEIAFGINSAGPANAPTSGPIGIGTMVVANGGAKISSFGGARIVGNPVLMNDSPLTFNGANSLEMSGNFDLGATNRLLIISNTAATKISGVITNGALIVSGPGVLTLSGTNTYFLGTVITNTGILLVNNTGGSGTGTNTVSILSGGTLGGTGMIAGLVTNGFGGTLSPGLGGLDTSTLTISNTLGLAGNALFTLNRTNAQTASKVAGLSSVRYGGTLTVTNVGDALQAGDTFTLFSSAAYSGSFTNVVLPALNPGLVWKTNNLSVNGSVTVAGPSALALSSSANPSGYLDALTFTANVTPTVASGSVIFFNGATPFSTNALVSGTAISTSISSLPRGTNTISAIYTGDLVYLASSNSLLQVVTNHAPVAGNATYTYIGGLTLKIKISNLLTNVTDADGDTITLTSTTTSTNGITLGNSSGYLIYTNATAVNDTFTYTVSDGAGDSATGLVTIIAVPSVFGQNATVTIGGSSATVSFAGIPGYTYGVQRSTNLVDWTTLGTTNLSSPVFDFNDTFGDLGVVPSSAYYRLQWIP